MEEVQVCSCEGSEELANSCVDMLTLFTSPVKIIIILGISW